MSNIISNNSPCESNECANTFYKGLIFYLLINKHKDNESIIKSVLNLLKPTNLDVNFSIQLELKKPKQSEGNETSAYTLQLNIYDGDYDHLDILSDILDENAIKTILEYTNNLLNYFIAAHKKYVIGNADELQSILNIKNLELIHNAEKYYCYMAEFPDLKIGVQLVPT